MADVGWVVLVIIGVAGIVWGAEAFAEHLGGASVALGVSSFALALLLAGAEPEELATGVAASLRHAPAVAFGDVIGANIAMCLVALGVGAVIAPLPFGRRVRLYGLLGLPVGAVCAALAWGGSVGRLGGLLLVALYVVYVGVILARRGRTSDARRGRRGRGRTRADGIGHGDSSPCWQRSRVYPRGRCGDEWRCNVARGGHPSPGQRRFIADADQLNRPGIVGGS